MKTLIAAIEFGSDNITGITALRSENGAIEICAKESEASSGCIHHGYVYNVNEAASKVNHIIQKLNNRLAPRSIAKVYVGIGGISVRAYPHKPTIHLGENVEITTEVLRSLKQQSLNTPLHDYDVLDAVTTQYDLDGHITQNPIGTFGNDLMAYHQLIIGKSSLRESIEAALKPLHIEIAGYIALPIATSLILSPEEKAKGCALIDFGAATTTVSVYKGGLQRLVVIPLGSETVTKDIMSKKLRHDVAENAKIKWSSALPTSDENETRPSKIETEAIGMDVSTLNNIVQCRYEEIIHNVRNQINISGYSSQLEAGCIITGGASLQKGLVALLSQLMPGMAIRTRAFNKYKFDNLEKKPKYAALLGMLESCVVDCEYHKPEPVVTESVTQPQTVSQHQPETSTKAPYTTPTTTVPLPQTPDVKTDNDKASAQTNEGSAAATSQGNGNSTTSQGNDISGTSQGNSDSATSHQPVQPHHEEVKRQSGNRIKNFVTDLFFGSED